MPVIQQIAASANADSCQTSMHRLYMPAFNLSSCSAGRNVTNYMKGELHKQLIMQPHSQPLQCLQLK
jgi:hypothetical protein